MVPEQLKGWFNVIDSTLIMKEIERLRRLRLAQVVDLEEAESLERTTRQEVAASDKALKLLEEYLTLLAADSPAREVILDFIHPSRIASRARQKEEAGIPF